MTIWQCFRNATWGGGRGARCFLKSCDAHHQSTRQKKLPAEKKLQRENKFLKSKWETLYRFELSTASLGTATQKMLTNQPISRSSAALVRAFLVRNPCDELRQSLSKCVNIPQLPPHFV